jgi:hypothetical protein
MQKLRVWVKPANPNAKPAPKRPADALAGAAAGEGRVYRHARHVPRHAR